MNENQNQNNINNNQNQNNTNNNQNEFVNHTNEFTKEQIESGKLMSVLSYLSVLALIPYFTEKNNPYVKFHAKQGMNIFIYEAILSALDSFLTPFTGLFGFVAYLGLVAFAILSIIGLVFALTGEAKEVPFLNKIAIIK